MYIGRVARWVRLKSRHRAAEAQFAIGWLFLITAASTGWMQWWRTQRWITALSHSRTFWSLFRTGTEQQEPPGGFMIVAVGGVRTQPQKIEYWIGVTWCYASAFKAGNEWTPFLSPGPQVHCNLRTFHAFHCAKSSIKEPSLPLKLSPWVSRHVLKLRPPLFPQGRFVLQPTPRCHWMVATSF